MPHRLTEEQKSTFQQQGWLADLPPVFDAAQVVDLNEGFRQLCGLLTAEEDSKEIREWHESSRWLFDICANEQILDYVEDILGPDFYLWASNFFAKEPGTSSTVGWHQDAFYWPLTPHNSVTVWIACSDSDESNGAMQVIPGTHTTGLIKHQRSTSTESVLTLELEEGSVRTNEGVPILLQAGQISLHDDRIIHGSPGNPSDAPRVGLTVRYSGTNVKCDLAVNPHFKSYLMRGMDIHRHNPIGEIPTQKFGRLLRQHLSIEEADQEQWHGQK
ncbi:MAG: phytanoyl-CoA dioxygenase family protein [Gemmatimonadetes bacterium]|jgi:non-haem Fe2+, alpha-ketoglutarate-dependent halogenase|nr:phytanoyl-CoA dioxygenase family protein [Gemmatimonadota bacterium]